MRILTCEYRRYAKTITYSHDANSSRLNNLSWDINPANTCTNPPATINRSLSRDADGRQTNTYAAKFPQYSTDSIPLTYGPSGMLTGAGLNTTTGKPLYNYYYNHQNLRLRKEGPTTSTTPPTTNFTYNTSGQLLAEDDGTTEQAYVYINGEPVAVLIGPSNGSSCRDCVHSWNGPSRHADACVQGAGRDCFVGGRL